MVMMSFSKKSVHSFLGFPTSIDTASTTRSTPTDKHLYYGCPHHRVSSSLTGGLGLISVTSGDVQRSPNVLESSSVKSTPASSSPPPKKDPGGIGFIDDIGGGVDGLMSCTESLGFESSDERRFDDKIEEEINDKETSDCGFYTRRTTRMKSRREGDREVKNFPPPLSSMNPNGQRSFFLRAVRKEGRLELTEVRIDRTEILLASRQDGRLRLHLIRDDDIHDFTEEEVEEDEDEEEELVEEVEPEHEEEGKELVLEEEKEIVEDETQKFNGFEEETEEKRFGDWKFPVSGEGFRRCQELGSHRDHHHHHNLHVWRQQYCVTTG
ncbi:hypothetical protein CJ030_MR8G008696 [Morella rubra]|uniref:FAF domain-containing protein n=1 Tax=Morella rubra TaxID=262757 RepID=A0A6A1UR75_9ROSI|nr:hypothetical protein CJ030_MR8G008696 [Morella rubra]